VWGEAEAGPEEQKDEQFVGVIIFKVHDSMGTRLVLEVGIKDVPNVVQQKMMKCLRMWLP
jgi:hypothetical protein